jgi:YD repeat-containing protein
VDTLSHKLCKQFGTLLSLCLITTHLHAATVNYQYDALGRLTFVEDAANGNRDYDYDKAGNRLLVSTNTTNDTAAEPGAASLPAPTGLSKSQIADCAWRASWNAVSGAAKYLVKDTSGGSVYVTATFADISCPAHNPSGNMPKSVQACDASNVCGIKANY